MIFGYRRVKVKEDDVDKAASLLLRRGIPTTVAPDGSFIIRERDMGKLISALKGSVDFDFSDLLGLYGYIRRIKNKAACVISVFLIAILGLISQNIIWDVRIEGNGVINDSEILYELDKCGFAVGNLWWLTDRSEIEARLLSEYPNLAWININRRGSVAYIDVIEKDGEAQRDSASSKYTNIVALEDSVIEEITVKSGVAVVEPGDVVKKGDLLISGVIPLEFGGGLCIAEGEVKGRVADRVEVTVPRSTLSKVAKKEKLTKLTFNFFDFSINILKKYGNLEKECDIIEEKETISLFGKKKLPFSFTKEYTREYEVVEKVYSDTELTAVAGRLLTAQIFSRLVNADLVKIKTNGSFTKLGYRIYSDFIFCADVGASLEYGVE